jgi:hypothetical protein
MRQTFPLKAFAACALALGLTPSALAQDEGSAVKAPTVNTKPFADLFHKGREMQNLGQLDLGRDMEFRAAADLNADGTLKPETLTLESTAHGEGARTLAMQFISAVSQSRILAGVDGAKQARLLLKLDRQAFAFRVAMEVDSAERAGRLATGYGILIARARAEHKGRDVGELYQGLRVSAEGTQFLVNFEIPRAFADRVMAEFFAREAARGRN